MESKFYIGQKVVAIADHSQGCFKKGDTFTVLGKSKTCCSYLIRIDDDFYFGKNICFCGKKFLHQHKFYSEKCFAPIQEISNMTYEEAIELVTEKQTA